MEKSRLDTLKEILERDPSDSFTRYALGLEFVSGGLLDEAAATFEELMTLDPNYHAVYYQLGKVYEGLGDIEKARKAYEKGIYVAASQSEFHTKEELESALNELF
jgi:tetratricopeptide (TPR) repeat protein